MPIKLANNASGTLATAISASDVGVVLASGDGAEFPALAAGEYFYATLVSSGGTQEIVKATARSGDALTIVRAQEGTTAASFAAGSRFEMRVTAASVDDRVDEAEAYALGLDTTLRAALAASSGSSLVGFLQAGASAVARTTQAKLRETVSVKDFGAVGDGVTDDTAAIQAAVTASKAVDFGGAENNYRVNGTITLQSGQTLVGSATVTQDATQTILFNADGRDNVTVRGLHMVGKSEAVFVNSPSSLAIAIRANGATDVSVEDCRFENFYYTTLGVLTSGTRIRFVDNFVKGPGAAVLGADINYRNCIGVVILGDSVVISGNDIYDTATGIILGQESSNAVISNNTLHDFINEHGIYVDTSVNNVTVSSNSVRNTGAAGDGIKIQHYTSYGVAPRNCVVVGNTVEETGNAGVSVLNSVPTGSPLIGNGVSIVGNQIRDTGGIGIVLRYWADAVVSGNSILTSANSGIDITGCQDVLVSSNQIKDIQFNGVFIGAAGGNDRIKVRGNQLYRPGLVGGGSSNASGVRVTGGTYVSLEGNRIIGDSANLEYGVFVESGDQTSLSVVENDISGANYAIRYKNTTDAPLALRDNRFVGVLQPTFNTAPLVSIASAASISVPTNVRVVRVTGTTNITNISPQGHTGSVVTFLFDSVLTVVRGGVVYVASNFTTSQFDTLTMCCDGNNWYELSRSAN